MQINLVQIPMTRPSNRRSVFHGWSEMHSRNLEKKEKYEMNCLLVVQSRLTHVQMVSHCTHSPRTDTWPNDSKISFKSESKIIHLIYLLVMMSRAVPIVVSVLLSAQIVADVDDTQQQQQDANYGRSNYQNICPFQTHFLAVESINHSAIISSRLILCNFFLFFAVWWMDDSLHSKTENENETRIDENLCVHTCVTDYLRKKTDFALLRTVPMH